MLSDVTEVYMVFIHLYYKKVQPKNPQMQHRPPCSREVFRHWWVTIIKTPKVRKMTKATLFDSFYASHHNETMNYVADCADCPCCPFLILINKLMRELDIRERRGGVCWTKTLCFTSRKTVANTRTTQLWLAWQVCAEAGIQKQQKSSITTCDVTAR